jgi:hypothetical protein
MRPYIKYLYTEYKWKKKHVFQSTLFGGNILCMNLFSWTQIICDYLVDLLRKHKHLETSENTVWNVNKSKYTYEYLGLFEEWNRSPVSLPFSV